MAIMNYETPNITKIEFEDNLFVTTEFDSYDNKKVKGYIESQGGIVKSSVTKSTNYLIYEDGKEETTKYKKALELVQEKGSDIKMLSKESFEQLITMTYETPNVSEILFNGKEFVTTGISQSDMNVFQEHVNKHGGVVVESVTKSTDYLIYQDDTWMTDEYKKALTIAQAVDSGIAILSFNTFIRLLHRNCDIEFGSYPTDKDGSKKPIQWSILKRDGNKALLLAVNGLDAKPYNEKWEDVTWEACTLRKWLNGEFYNTAFTKEEKTRIQLTELKNEDNPEYQTPGGNDTKDKVFLLSIDEVQKYLTDYESVATPTPYAVKQGVYESGAGKCWWWLRSPGDYSDYAAGVRSAGGINDFGNRVDDDFFAVCPALWIDLESEI